MAYFLVLDMLGFELGRARTVAELDELSKAHRERRLNVLRTVEDLMRGNAPHKPSRIRLRVRNAVRRARKLRRSPAEAMGSKQA